MADDAPVRKRLRATDVPDTVDDTTPPRSRHTLLVFALGVASFLILAKLRYSLPLATFVMARGAPDWVVIVCGMAMSALPSTICAIAVGYLASTWSTRAALGVGPVGCVVYWFGYWAYLRLTLPTHEELMRQLEGDSVQSFTALARIFGSESGPASSIPLSDMLSIASVPLVFAVAGSALGASIAWLAKNPERAKAAATWLYRNVRPGGPDG